MSKCSICTTKKSTLECGLCHCATCKNCTEFITEETFRYADQFPQKLVQSPTYCLNCYTTDVLPEIESYEKMLEQAKEIAVFDITQTKETRLIKRLEPTITVKNCLDQPEATLKLAYIAAKLNFNSIIDMNLKTVKIRDGSYQTSEVNGTAIPAHVSESKLLKDRSLRTNPN
jgi:uncharacterized protein YbjQ (UPF0145 family)